MKRFSDAIAIQEGACNPSGIAYSLLDAIAEARQEGCDACSDPAVRLIAHQLAYILNVREIDTSLDVWSSLMDKCRTAVARHGTTATVEDK